MFFSEIITVFGQRILRHLCLYGSSTLPGLSVRISCEELLNLLHLGPNQALITPSFLHQAILFQTGSLCPAPTLSLQPACLLTVF